MEDPSPDKEAPAEAEAATKPKGQAARQAVQAVLNATGILLPKVGLVLFIVLTLVILAAYPAYVLSSRLIDYSAATVVDARFAEMSVDTVSESRDESSSARPKKHIEIALTFKTENGKIYVATLSRPHPSPGLKRKLEDQFEVGSQYKLYLVKGNEVFTDDEVAKDIFLRLTSLMGLVLLVTVVFVMLWHRLALRMPDKLPGGSGALARSLVYGQLVTLLVAALLLVVMTQSPLVVSIQLYLAAYWGLAAFLSLALRLLLFSDPVVEVAEVDSEKSDALRTAKRKTSASGAG